MDESLKACPFCKEPIRAKAVKCRFCGEWLEKPAASLVSVSPAAVALSIPPAPTSEKSGPPVDALSVAGHPTSAPSVADSAQPGEPITPTTQTDSTTERSSLPERTPGPGTATLPKPIEVSQTFLDEQRSDRLRMATLIYGAILLVYFISAGNRCWSILGAGNALDAPGSNVLTFIINTLGQFISHAFMSVMGILFLATYVLVYQRNRTLKTVAPKPVATGHNEQAPTAGARLEPAAGLQPPLTPVHASYEDFRLAEQAFCKLQQSLNRNPTREQWEPEFLARKNPATPLPRLVLEELWIAADPAAWEITAQRPAPVSAQPSYRGLQWVNGIFIVITGWGCIVPLIDGSTAPSGFQLAFLVGVMGVVVMFSNLSAILAARQPANPDRRIFAKWANTIVMSLFGLLFCRYAITSASLPSYLAAGFMALPAVINILAFGKPLKKSAGPPVTAAESMDSPKVSPAKFNLAGASFLLAGVIMLFWMFRDVNFGRANLQTLAESLTVMIAKSLIAAGLVAWIFRVLSNPRTGRAFLVFAVTWAGLTAYDATLFRSAFEKARAAQTRSGSDEPTTMAATVPAAASPTVSVTPAMSTLSPTTTETADSATEAHSLISECTDLITTANSNETYAITQLAEANIYDPSLLTNKEQMLAEMQKRVSAQQIYWAFETNMDYIMKDTQVRLDRLGTPQANKSAEQLAFDNAMSDLFPTSERTSVAMIANQKGEYDFLQFMVNAFGVYQLTDGGIRLPTAELVSQYNALVQNVSRLENAVTEDQKDEIAASARGVEAATAQPATGN